jgi:hypothetical protein
MLNLFISSPSYDLLYRWDRTEEVEIVIINK